MFDLVGLALTRQWWDIPALALSLWGPGWLRALTYVTTERVFGVWPFMLSAGAGVAGLGSRATVPLIVLARHRGYGLTLVWLYQPPQASTASR
jgi:hypothetical protein